MHFCLGQSSYLNCVHCFNWSLLLTMPFWNLLLNAVDSLPWSTFAYKLFPSLKIHAAWWVLRRWVIHFYPVCFMEFVPAIWTHGCEVEPEGCLNCGIGVSKEWESLVWARTRAYAETSGALWITKLSVSLNPVAIMSVCREQWEQVTYECFLHSKDFSSFERLGLNQFAWNSLYIFTLPFLKCLLLWMLYDVCIFFVIEMWVNVMNCISVRVAWNMLLKSVGGCLGL